MRDSGSVMFKDGIEDHEDFAHGGGRRSGSSFFLPQRRAAQLAVEFVMECKIHESRIRDPLAASSRQCPN